MHTFDASARAPYQRYIPSMRTAQDSAGGSGTPIYDALCSEYRRLFRTLPGDRTGEEQVELGGFSAWHTEYRGFAPGGRHRGNNGPAALPPGRGDNRLR
ncbi:hypothetical protein [Streptomyces sp. NBC_01190]|uniref:hypothetical protein n=1 Tax=Streptomyces sp. NBC_01190 TaxID=2903767 RepID=UPI003870E0C5|nr:hypothetical protein OG519_06520 [Streptomyces sp. NBC_01190]